MLAEQTAVVDSVWPHRKRRMIDVVVRWCRGIKLMSERADKRVVDIGTQSPAYTARHFLSPPS